MYSLFSFLNIPWVTYSFTAIYMVTVLVIMGIILAENRNPVKSLAWVTVLLLLPLVGLVLYLFFGRSIKNTRMISRRNRRKLRRADRLRSSEFHRADHSIATKQQLHLARSLSGTGYTEGNDVTVFTNGAAKFAALERDLRQARKYINLQYYIFCDDRVGRRIRDILIDRAQAGVTVRVIYDHVGSLHTSRRFFREMSRAGIQVHPFFKVTFPPFGTRINWRNHRKLCVIDGEIGYIGGMNIADRYIDGGKAFDVWRDSHLRVTGPSVGALQYSFAVDWNFMGMPLIDDEIPDSPTLPGNMGAQLITAGPTNQWSNVEYMFHRAIACAQNRIYIQTPYFLPTEGLLKALQTAALSNVDVRIMLPRRSDSSMLKYASFSYIAECLRAGIKIYLYEPGMLHAKTLIIDDEMASVGSTNFDFRSFEYNFEANLFIYSREFNRHMTDIFLSDQKQCKRILAAQWVKRPYTHKAYESVLRLLSPIL